MNSKALISQKLKQDDIVIMGTWSTGCFVDANQCFQPTRHAEHQPKSVQDLITVFFLVKSEL